MPNSAAVAPAPLRGHTKPRLYTPPLLARCDPTRADSCDCGCGLNPDTSWGFECCDFLENVLKWVLLPYQRWLYIHALEKGLDGSGFRFQTVVILISRQNGKTAWLRGLGLWRMYLHPSGRPTADCPAAKNILITAQGLEYAEATLDEVVDDVKNCPTLKREFVRHGQTNGKHRMILRGKRLWRAAAANRDAGRSLSLDLVELDELRQHRDWLAWNAIVPTTTARPYSQAVAASNAGDKTSVVLRSLRDGAIKRIIARDTDDTRIGFFEWSVPEDADPLDRQFWPMANPGLGFLPGHDEESLAATAEAMADNMPGFKTEHCCQWVDTLAPGVIPMDGWEATTDPTSRRAEGAPVWAAVDVNFQRTRSYVAVAARRSDGLLHIEVVAAKNGTDWIIPWFKERAGKFQGVALQQRGAPASGLIDDLTAAGVPVIEWGGADLPKGCAQMFDLVRDRLVRHRPSPSLDSAAKSTPGRYLGDGAMVFDRKGSPVDASPLVACAAAAWAESEGPPEPEPEPQIHDWPDEEEIAMWENEELD